MALETKKYEPPPRTGMDVFNMLPEGTLAEVINNVVYIFEPPNYFHQSVSGHLAAQIYVHLKSHRAGKCIVRPIDVFLDEQHAVQPDILATVAKEFTVTDDEKIVGAPDFIIEILSPGNRRHDTITKKALYEKFRVKEYFIIDPETKETIAYYLTDKKFVRQETTKGKIKSKLLKKVFSF